MQDSNLSQYGRHIAISTTNSCPIKCAHCISGSSPASAKASEGLIGHFSLLLREWPNVRHVSLTGGEPFEDLQALRRFAHLCSDHGIRVGAITSGFWGKTSSRATSVLASVPGLATLTISSDVYHLKFVPVPFIKNCYAAAKERGISARIRLTTSSVSTQAELDLKTALLSFCENDDLEEARLVPYGRARTDLPEASSPSPQAETKYGLCPSTGPHVFEDGNVTPCCNSIVALRNHHPLQFGNCIAEDASKLRQRQLSDELFLTIKIFGFDFLLTKLRDTPAGYEDYSPANACEFCFDICTNSQLLRDISAIIRDEEFQLKLHMVALYEFGNEASIDRIRQLANARRVSLQA